MKRLLSVLLCLCLLAAPALASGEASGASGGRYLTINADGLTLGESDTWTVEGEAPVSADTVTGLRFQGGSASDRFLSVTAPAHVDPAAGGFTAVIGSDDELWPAPNFAEIYTNEGLSPNSEGFDLDYTWIGQIDWEEASPTYGRYTPVTAAGQAMLSRLLPADAAYSVYVRGGTRDDESRSGATQATVSGGAAALIQNAFIYGEGASGLAVSNSGSAGVGSTLVVRDSLLMARAYVPASAGTSENMPNDPLLVTGASRASLSGGESVTYYYDSVITVDGWASLSTDAASGNGVDLIAADTFASALLGGYGTYSDHDCRDYYYGSVLEGAEIGVIISGDGRISLYDGDDGLPGGAGYNVGLHGDIDPYAYAGPDTNPGELGGSVIAGGRTGVMIHIAGNYSADPQNENAGGTFTAKDSAVITDRSLLSDEDLEYSVNASWYGRELSPNIEKYIEYISGDAILLKSVNAAVVLDNADIVPYSGVLVHSVINNDTGTVVTPADADPLGNIVSLRNMTAEGDILDEDYERPMTLTLDNTTLTGRIVSGTAESWEEYWLAAGYAEDYTIGYASNTFGAEAPLDGFVHTLTMNDDGTYEIAEYGESKGVSLTLAGGSVWNVAGESSLDALTVEAGCEISGVVTVDGEAVDVSAGGSWEGEILVTPPDAPASGDASDEASGGASPDPVYTVSDEGLAVDESLVTIELAPDAVVSDTEISGVYVSSTENGAGGVLFTAEEGALQVGGPEDSFTVTTHFTGEELGFNTVIDLREADGYVWGTDSSGGSAIAARGSGEMVIENLYARNTGIGRYTVNLNSGTTIIRDSYFESVGADGEYSSMPWFTSQFGNSRCLIACGTLNAYIYNSTAASEGFGSWSTDAGGDPYSFYLYNGDALNRYGGYGTYADVGLTVHIYGSRFDSAEFGAFVSNSGILYLGSSADAPEADDEVFLENLAGQELAEDTPTEIIADQNAIAFHVVDLMTAADPATGLMDSAVSDEWLTMLPVLNAKNSLLTTEGASWSMEIDFPAAQQAWLDHLHGATIAFRGCCGIANLENVDLGSSSGILIMTCLDLDSSAVQILDDVATEDIPGCQVNSVDNVWTGDIVHEDYQRPLRLSLVNTTLTGAIQTYDIDHWNALFADYEDVRYVLDEETGRYVNADDPAETGPNYTARDPGQIYGMLCGLKTYDAVRGTFLAMDADSVWNVTASSNLNSLTTEPGAVVNGTVTVDGETVDVSAGGSWEGEIVVEPAGAPASGEAS